MGKATDWGFNKRISKFIVDPLLDTSVSDLKDFEPEIVFICVPTPMGDDIIKIHQSLNRSLKN